MEAPNPSRPLDCEVDILRLAVRKKNGLGHELLGSNDNGEQQQREKSQHCFRFNSCLTTTSTSTSTTSTSTFLLRTGRFQVFSLSVFTCFTRSPPSGARSPGATSGGRPAELRKRTGWRAIGPPRCFHIPVPVPPQCLHIPVPRTAQPASRNTSNICQPLGQGLTCLLQVGYLYSSIYLSCLSMFVGGFSNQLTPNFFLHQGLMI